MREEETRDGREAVFDLASDDPKAQVCVRYAWNENQPVLHKYVTIRNDGPAAWERLLDVRLGTYATDAAEYHDPDWPVRLTGFPWSSTQWSMVADPAGRLRGFPAYLENQFFAGLAHPAGYALLENQSLRLLQHPGIKLGPGKTFTCMEAIYGVAGAEAARAAFRDYLRTRMRRVLRGHDKPYAIIDTCAAQPGENFFAVSGKWCLDHIAKMAEGQRDAGLHWDYYCIEFWHDAQADLKAPDTKRFPEGFGPIFAGLARLGTLPGLWVNSGGKPEWTFGRNPAVRECGTQPGGVELGSASSGPYQGEAAGARGMLCRSAGPVNRMYIEGLTHQIRANGVRLLKFDGLGIGEQDLTCSNPAHEHLPGVYSVEANHNAQIELLDALDKECPEAFFILYWGHRSPWWLLHGDTIFDVGGRMEMASLDVHPTLYARSSNVRRLDQARRMVKDFPPLGWDTLGVCLSGGRWNNDLGTEHWQEGVLMDICRGGLLLHIWSDNQAVPLADRPQMAEFIRLLKARPACFANPRFIGDVRTSDVWGYCCTDGRGAMIALDNGSWEDQEVSLALNSRWGLPNQGPWDLYCWYPDHARLVSHDGGPIRGGASMTLRPFTPVLLEVVPAGEKPALARDWRKQQLPGRPVEAARTLAVAATRIEGGKGRGQAWTIRGEVPASKTGGWLAVTTEFRREGRPALWTNNKPLSMSGSLDGAPAQFQAVLPDLLFAAPWQTYRLPVGPASGRVRSS